MASPSVIEELLREEQRRRETQDAQTSPQAIIQGIMQGVKLYDMVKELGYKYGQPGTPGTPGKEAVPGIQGQPAQPPVPDMPAMDSLRAKSMFSTLMPSLPGGATQGAGSPIYTPTTQPQVAPGTPLPALPPTAFTNLPLPSGVDTLSKLAAPQGMQPAIPSIPSTPGSPAVPPIPAKPPVLGWYQSEALKGLANFPDLARQQGAAMGLGNIGSIIPEEKLAAQEDIARMRIEAQKEGRMKSADEDAANKAYQVQLARNKANADSGVENYAAERTRFDILKLLPSRMPPNTPEGAAAAVQLQVSKIKGIVTQKNITTQELKEASLAVARAISGSAPHLSTVEAVDFTNTMAGELTKIAQFISSSPKAVNVPEIKYRILKIGERLSASTKPFIERGLKDIEDTYGDRLPKNWPNMRKRQLEGIPEEGGDELFPKSFYTPLNHNSALEWANAHPDDPRSKEIKRRASMALE